MIGMVKTALNHILSLFLGSLTGIYSAANSDCTEYNPITYYEIAKTYVKQSKDISEDNRFRGVYKKAEIEFSEVRRPEGSEVSDGIIAVVPIHVDNGTINLEIWPDCAIFANEYRRW